MAVCKYFNLGQIDEIDENKFYTGNTIRPNEFALDAGYSRILNQYFGLGLVFRFIYSDIAAGTSNLTAGSARYEPGVSFAADISAYFQKPITLSKL
ncbi:MAG: hypothetical protein HC830_14975 [Bacteroidetes bacterium]|nr:hypothetical protein [Bacteroidota bacterium]